MQELYPNRKILCIDLKSFFASVECVERQLDPYKTPLVVCDPNRNGAITLAVTPYLKQFGINGRTRIFEIPKNIPIIKVPPRISLYRQKSKEVIDVYLEYVSSEDLHIYSIDECFLDVTNYLRLYNKTEYELTIDIINRIKEKTGLTATAGIGPNILLAKVGMDIEAKHNSDNIAYWDYTSIKTKLWNITPLSKMWGIGSHMEKNLNKLGIKSIGDLAKFDKGRLKDLFGIMGEELWYHANGIDSAKISDLNTAHIKEKSYSHSQVLFKDYYDFNITIIIFEMLDVLCRRLRTTHKLTGLLGFGINYSKEGGFYHSTKLPILTDDINNLYRECMHIFNRYYDKSPIRKVSISFSNLTENQNRQLNLFENPEQIKDKIQINLAIDGIKNRFGNNSIIPASALLSDSTLIERNSKN